jgi:hypothetical protein
VCNRSDHLLAQQRLGCGLGRAEGQHAGYLPILAQIVLAVWAYRKMRPLGRRAILGITERVGYEPGLDFITYVRLFGWHGFYLVPVVSVITVRSY